MKIDKKIALSWLAAGVVWLAIFAAPTPFVRAQADTPAPAVTLTPPAVEAPPPSSTTAVAVAPQGSVNPGNIISLAPLLNMVLAALGSIAVAVITFEINAMAAAIKARFKVAIDQTFLDRGKSAAATAAGIFVANAENTSLVKNAKITVATPGIAELANNALAKIPDVVANNPQFSAARMSDLVVSELGKLQAAGTAPATDPPKPV
jgi:hypothetical protein